MNRIELLRWDVFENCEKWLRCADGLPKPPQIGLGKSYETVWVQNFPLPNHYRPDYIDLALIVKAYPLDPPKGIYLLSSATSRDLITSFKKRFNVFRDRAFHNAPSVDGYEWICFGYLSGWRYNARAPHKGDNLGKLMRNLWHELES